MSKILLTVMRTAQHQCSAQNYEGVSLLHLLFSRWCYLWEKYGREKKSPGFNIGVSNHFNCKFSFK